LLKPKPIEVCGINAANTRSGKTFDLESTLGSGAELGVDEWSVSVRYYKSGVGN